MQKTSCFRNILSITAITLCFALSAKADFTPDIGARASLAGAQELLVSPPIPNLEGGKKTYSPQIGYMTAKVDGGDTQTDPSTGITDTLSYTGDVKGVSGAIGFSAPSSGRLAWFAIVGGDSLSGDVDININGSSQGTIKDIKTQSFAFAAGPSYRFMGEANSPISAGAFLGPAAIRVSSKFKTTNNNGDYSLEDTIYGAYGGLQFKVRTGSLVINPYVLYMYELSPKCKKMTVSDPMMDFGGLCPDDPMTPNLVEMKSSFGGAGLFLGWNSFRVNVYSKSSNDKAFKDIKITNYSVSYTFGD